jgi:hypothetical protein
MICEC